MRRSWRLETGRSVATMTMQLPLVRRVLADAPVDFKADGMPADLQVSKAAVVCLREHAEREAFALDFKNA